MRHIVVGHRLPGAQRGDQFGAEVVHGADLAGQAGAARGRPVAANAGGAPVVVDLGVQHARGLQYAPQQRAGGGGHVVRVVQLANAVGQFELECLVFPHFLELLDFFGQRLRVVIRGRDVVPLREQPRHAPVLADDRLVQQVDIAILQRGAGLALQRDFQIAQHDRLAARQGAVEHGAQVLRGHLGQGVEHGLADQLAMPDQVVIGFVSHLEDMVGTGEHGNEARRLIEHRLQLAALDAQDTRHRFVHLRPVHLRDVGHRVGALLQVVLAGRDVEAVQIGHIDGVLRHEGNVAGGVEHRCVNRAPVALVEYPPVQRLARHRVAQQRAGVGLFRRYGQLDRHAHFVQVGRVRVVRISGKGIEDMLAHDLLGGPSRRLQIRGIGANDEKIPVDEQVGIGRRREQRRIIGLGEHHSFSHTSAGQTDAVQVNTRQIRDSPLLAQHFFNPYLVNIHPAGLNALFPSWRPRPFRPPAAPSASPRRPSVPAASRAPVPARPRALRAPAHRAPA